MSIKCKFCGKKLNGSSAGITSHMRSHVRDGLIIETKDDCNKLLWKSKDGKIKQNATKEKSEPKKVNWSFGKTKPKYKIPERDPQKVKLNKNGNLKMKCKCGKWSNPQDVCVDDRFTAMFCECGSISLLPIRVSSKMKPGDAVIY